MNVNEFRETMEAKERAAERMKAFLNNKDNKKEVPPERVVVEAPNPIFAYRIALVNSATEMLKLLSTIDITNGSHGAEMVVSAAQFLKSEFDEAVKGNQNEEPTTPRQEAQYVSPHYEPTNQ